ncbi:hypothetical protein [Salinicola avicenniae]|uniref:hypothetical protein n=1 Tax=Salinicola avicenniae TaxID=2916836 RepID=UPI002072C804|nr:MULTISPECIES: hypothetical protein [unclassified Salinicola]
MTTRRQTLRPLWLALVLVAGLPAIDAVAAPATPTAATETTETDISAGLHELQSRWAQIRYRTPEARRESAFDQLYQRAQALTNAHPDSAALATWAGIIRASQAGAGGGLSALSQVKDARQAFEHAIALDPQVLSGSAYTSLGTLYHQVPGWPISFGDDDRARELLLKGLAIDPDGLDSNYFWADYLHDNDDDAGARQALQKAEAAAPRPGREIADAGRREEIRQLAAELDD